MKTQPAGFAWALLFSLAAVVLVSHLVPLYGFEDRLWGSHAFVIAYVLLRRRPPPSLSLPGRP